MLYYGQIKLDWQCEPFLWLPAVCSSASAPQGTLFVQPAHHSVCTWSLSAAPHLPYIHDDILRLLHPIPSLTHSQCLSMNGSDIMNNSRRTGRPISYWSFQPPPSCAAAVCHGWRRICLAMDWMVQQTGHTGRQWIYYSGYSLLLLRQYLHSDIIVSDLPVSTFSAAGQSCVAHQLLCRLACMQYLTP